MRLIDTRGRLSDALQRAAFPINPHASDQYVYNLATLLAHQGGLLLRLEESWAGLNLDDAPPEAMGYAHGAARAEAA